MEKPHYFVRHALRHFVAFSLTLLWYASIFLELVEVIEMLMQSQIEYPILKTKYSTYIVDYPDVTKNIEGVISNEKLFGI